MQVLNQIIFNTIDIITLISGILGILGSLLILCTLDTTKNLSDVMNKCVYIEKKLRKLDKNVSTENFLYNHHIITEP